MANKKLSQFNTVTEVDENYRIPAFKANQDNYDILPSNLGKSVSIWDSVTTSVTAYAGGGQANATAMTTKWTVVTTCATRNDSIKAPAALAGKHFFAINSGAQNCQIYPQTGENFNGKAANAAIDLPVNTYMEILCVSDGVWLYRPIISVYTAASTITAYAGGGQANATQLNSEYNKVTVVGTNGDSVKLRAAIKGLRMVVVNADAAQNMDVYPQTGDNFEGLAANTAKSIPFGEQKEFFCFADAEWTELI